MSTSVPIHTDFNLQKELCYFQNRLQSTMTDLRPLMGLRFECVSVSDSPGLDSKGLHQRKLRGFMEPQKGCSPHYRAIYLQTSWQSFMSLTNPCICCFDQKLEIQSTRDTIPSPPIFSLCIPSATTHLSETRHVLLGGCFPNCFLMTKLSS